MGNFTNNIFVQAIGVSAVTYLLLRSFGWGMEVLLKILSSFSYWFRYTAVPYIDEAAIAFGVCYLLIAAVTSSQQSKNKL